jgi:hypothetical protein
VIGDQFTPSFFSTNTTTSRQLLFEALYDH